MSEVYKVNDLKHTGKIIDAALKGVNEFEINEDDLNKHLKNYGLTVDDLNSVENLMLKGTFKDWFDSVNDENIPENVRTGIYNMCTAFTKKVNVLKELNDPLYHDMIKFIAKDFGNDDIDNFELPKLSKPIINTVDGNE